MQNGDALEIFRAMRPNVPERADAPNTGRGRDLHDLAMVPGSPSYRARIPPPPCFKCGEDHVPGQSYDHSWMPEPVVHDEPVSASVITRRPTIVDQTPFQAFRVALYVGRGDTYVVAVETPPDWDQHVAWKVQPEMVMPLINLARALEQKVVDKTGGDLLMLEQEYASQFSQAHGGRTAADGDHGARRAGPDPDGPTASESPGAEPTNGSVPGGRRGRGHPAE